MRIAVCAACREENPAAARFCLACGTPLVEVVPRDERRVVTVIFVDLVSFTARAERLDPEDVRAVLAPYHEHVRREIESFGGVVEKFIGDAVMGIFGAPVAHGDDAERAVRAGLEIRDSIRRVTDADLQIRIAVNTGDAVVSLAARPALGESMVAGDVVNTASRLQSAAPINGVVVGEQTYIQTRDVIEYEAAEPVIAKGKTQAVVAWVAVRPLTVAGERPRVDTSMLGRDADMAVLTSLWERARAGRVPHLTSIFGAAGIGKSTLATEFASVASARGARVVRGRSLPYRESGAYGALSSQIMRLCGVFASDSAVVIADALRERSASLLASADADPELVAGHLGTIVGVDAGTGASDRDALFASVRHFLEAVAREQPTVLVFEDVHWADPNLLDLIDTIATRVHGLALMQLTLARPEFLDARTGWGARVAEYTALTLCPLEPDEARDLAARRLEDPSRVDEVLAVAEGNPLFIEQIAATLDETTSGTLPTGIRGIVAARLDALPAAERAVLLDAAVVGRVFWPDALRATNTDGPALERAVEELERRDLIRSEPTSILEGRHKFAFTNVIIRDVAYDLLSRADRVRRHALAAQFFERAVGASAEAIGALARHWRDAGEPDRAIEQLTRAAEHAERGWAKNRAVSLYREALELVPEEDAERRTVLRRRLALATAASFHMADVRRAGSQRA